MVQSKITDNIVFKTILLIILLYAFLSGISLMSATFKQFKDVAVGIIETAKNPFVGLMIGIIATSIVQSSSSTTSTVVTLVAGGVIPVDVAIPIIMGANIGTSVTNTIVSLGNLSIKEDFYRAFSASTVHDFFNMFVVLIFFPLQLMTGFLSKSASYLSSLFSDFGGLKFSKFLKVILEPFVSTLQDLANNNFAVLIIISLLLLFLSLNFLSKVLKSLLLGRFENLFDKYVFKNAITSFIFGLGLTILVQSSSISTSLIVPIAGAGFVTLYQIVPYTIGANVGTTVTAMLASFAAGNPAGVTVAFAHFLFNVFGGIIVYPFRSLPIKMSQKLSLLALKNRMIPVLYILCFFFLIPFMFYLIFN